MLAVTLRRTATRPAANMFARAFSDEASNVTLNFAMPHGAIYEDEEVELVRLMSVAGEFGVTAGHTPNVSQLAPGLALVYKTKDAEPDTYFVSGKRKHTLFYNYFSRYFFFLLWVACSFFLLS